mgnify:FL=1
MAITRDDLLNDSLRQRLRDEAAQGKPNPLLSEEVFQASLANTLEQFEQHDELWVFGYGSLIWNPTFNYVREEIAHLPGHERRFCLWAESGRGSPETPGLWLALDTSAPETHCTGLAFQIDNAHRENELLLLWRREMVTGAYAPAIRQFDIAGQTRACLCLLANKDHRRYAGLLPHEQVVEAIALAEGHLGTCREYLFNLVNKLSSLGVPDQPMHRLTEQVGAYRAARSLTA